MKLNYPVVGSYPSVYRRVFPIMQKSLYNIIEKLDKEHVEEVWVFGSSVTEYCGQDSDLDICIVTDIPVDYDYVKGLRLVSEVDVDFVICTKEEVYSKSKNVNSLFYDIIEEGVKIYER